MARKDVTVPMDESLNREIEQQLGYGDSKAGWIREAIKLRLAKERDGVEGADESAVKG